MNTKPYGFILILAALAVFTTGCPKHDVKPLQPTPVPVVTPIEAHDADRDAIHRLVGTPAPTPIPEEVWVHKGDTLWSISKQVYGEHWLWPVLCQANELDDCDLIEPGRVLFYPARLNESAKQTARAFAYADRWPKKF